MFDKKIYILKNRLHIRGPYTLEMLKNKTLTQSDLVWYDGLPDWTKAHLLDPLKDFVKLDKMPERSSFWKRNKLL
ncbi:MAG: GYF domain-containing protein [Sediminibacterium sp.]|nr:GYF domain-containing protein [Sediminibacterium sp.]TXT32547.1 MAG: hypothetical protein FD136_1283 [Chitinophagaceae bacterium]